MNRYFTATPSSHPNERRLFRVKVEQPYSDHAAECISCLPERQEIKSEFDMKLNDRTFVVKPRTESKKKQSIDRKQLKPSIILSRDRTTLRSNKSCSYVTDVKFSKKNKFYILVCSGPEIPYETLYSTENTRKPILVC